MTPDQPCPTCGRHTGTWTYNPETYNPVQSIPSLPIPIQPSVRFGVTTDTVADLRAALTALAARVAALEQQRPPDDAVPARIA